MLNLSAKPNLVRFEYDVYYVSIISASGWKKVVFELLSVPFENGLMTRTGCLKALFQKISISDSLPYPVCPFATASSLLNESTLRLRRSYLYASLRGRLRVVLFLLVIIGPQTAYGQWTMIAPGILGPLSSQGAIIVAKSGLVWAGAQQLFMSTNNGMSWTLRSPAIFSNDVIRDVCFFDAITGLVATSNGSIFRTDDQGMTWKEIHRSPSCSSISFCGTVNSIILTSGGGGTVEYSLDGGLKWKNTGLDAFAAAVVPLKGNSALALAGALKGASLFVTHDNGATWARTQGKIDLDSYSFCIDPCADSLVYVVNEEGTTVSDALSEIFVTTDQGNTWTPHGQMPRTFYCGSISVASNAVYVQTIGKGVFRSTNSGQTWKSIGGPSAPFDTRLICALDDNLLLAADASGAIWRTLNSGGDTVHGVVRFTSLKISPPFLFATDSLLRCDTPVVRSVVLSAKFCSVPSVIGQAFSGTDSMDYGLARPSPHALTGSDTISISFLPQNAGPQNGALNLTLEDGTVIRIPLFGYGKSTHSVTMTTLDVSSDTIGGIVRVPIIMHGDSALPAIECIVNYDTTTLIYDGCYASDGSSIEKPGTRWPGHAGIHVDSLQLAKDSVIGYAVFEGYPLDTSCRQVRFDSLSVLAPLTPCAFNPSGNVVSNVCLPHGCGVVSISRFMRYRQFPDVRLYPNPASNHFSLVASEDLDGRIEILDLLGHSIKVESAKLAKGVPFEQNVTHLPKGKYWVRIVSGSSIRTLSLLLH